MTAPLSPSPRRSPRFCRRDHIPTSLTNHQVDRRLQFETREVVIPTSVDIGQAPSATYASHPSTSQNRPVNLHLSGVYDVPPRPPAPCHREPSAPDDNGEPMDVQSSDDVPPEESDSEIADRLDSGEITAPRCTGDNNLNLLQGHSGTDPAVRSGGAISIRRGSDREGEVRAARADSMSAVFCFLSSRTTRQLRKVLKDWRWKQSGNKGTLAARAFLHVKVNILSGKTVQDVMLTNIETQRFESWLTHRITLDSRSPLYLKCAASDPNLFKFLERTEVENFERQRLNLQRAREGPTLTEGQTQPSGVRNTEGETASNQGATQGPVQETFVFSISEFARLCIIMKDDEDAKCALAGTGQELTRSQIDSGFNRDSYWGVIKSRFNDASLRLNLNMTGHIDNVDSSQPAPCHLSASFLKDKFLDAKKSYTEKLSNWSQSGQNDNIDFKRFAGTRNGELTADGKRNMVIFVCARMGTANEDTRFSNLCSRVIPFGRGCDEGGTQRSQQGASEMAGRSNRRKSKNDTESAFETSWMKCSEVGTAEKRSKVEERLERAEKRKRMRTQNTRKEFLEGRQWVVLSMGNLQQSMKSSGFVPDKTFEQCAKMQMEELRKVFMMPQQEALGLPCEMPQSEE